MKRFSLAALFIVVVCASASSQESLRDLAKRVKPSVVTVISVGNKKCTNKSGSGFFVAQPSISHHPGSDDMTTFARRVKSKLKDYVEVDDQDLVRRILERTPEYRNRVKFSYPLQELAPKIIRVNDVRTGSFIVTNWHVVANSTSIIIKTEDQQSYAVIHVVAYSVEGDLALLQTNAPTNKYSPLEIAKAFPEEGERVLVIGSPLGVLEGTCPME